MEIRMAAFYHARCYPEQYIEFVNACVHTSWLNYLAKMSSPGEWCDNIIVQATADSFNCVILLVLMTQHLLDHAYKCGNRPDS
jgi:hypothetical protein